MISPLRQLRQELGLTQAEFAAKLGSRQTTVAGWESSPNGPPETVIKLICQTFGANPGFLRTGIGDKFLPVDRDQLLGEKVGRVLALPDNDPRRITLEFILDLPPECWHTVLDYAIRLSKSCLPDDL